MSALREVTVADGKLEGIIDDGVRNPPSEANGARTAYISTFEPLPVPRVRGAP
jgi:hypothetical protein